MLFSQLRARYLRYLILLLFASACGGGGGGGSAVVVEGPSQGGGSTPTTGSLRLNFDVEDDVMAQLPRAVASARITLTTPSGQAVASRNSEREQPWQEDFANLPTGLTLVRIQFYDASGALLGTTQREVSIGAGSTTSVQISSMIPDEEPPVDPPAEAVRLSFLIQPNAPLTGETFRVEVTALDEQGQRVTHAEGQVSLRLEGGETLNGADVVSLSEGVASWPNLSIAQAASGLVLVAESEGLLEARSSAFSVGQAPPQEPERVATSLTFLTVPEAQVVAGETFLVRVEVRDQFGDRLDTAQLTLRLSLASDPVPPAGAVFTPLALNADEGVGDFLIALNKAGSYRLSATSTGLAGALSSTVEVGPGAPHALVILDSPEGGTARVALPSTAVGVEDAYGNAVSSPQVPITVARATGGSAVLSGTLTQTTVEGIATFDDLELDRANLGTRLVATSASLSSATSSSFDVVAATANSLRFVSTPPATLTAGVSPAGTDAQVEVLDDQGERVLDFEGDIWLQLKADGFVKALGAGGNLPTLTGASVQADEGLATFSDFSANFTGAYTIQANAAGVASALPEATFSVTHGAPARIVIRSQPTGGEIGVRLNGSASAELRDANENRVMSYMDGVELRVVDATVGPGGSSWSVGTAGGTYSWFTGAWGRIGRASGYGNFEIVFPGLTPARATRFLVAAWEEIMVSEGVVFQDSPDALERRVGSDSEGNFAVVTSNSSSTSSARNIRVHRYDSVGVSRGAAIAVSTGVTASIAMNSSGDFVVAYVRGGSSPQIYARLYDATGTARGPEFVASMTSSCSQPTVAINDAGEVALAWHRQASTAGSPRDIMARRFNADGSPQGDEFLVNTVTTGTQQDPAIALGDDGEMMVTWRTNQLHGQVYDAVGRVGTELTIGNTSFTQTASSVAVDDSGRFVVAWNSLNQDGSELGVYARRYNSDAQALGGEFRVNTYTAGNQSSPCVDTDDAGNFVVTWNSTLAQDGSGFGVYLQRYNSSAQAQGVETRVNTTTDGYQGRPSVAMTSPTVFQVAWKGMGRTARLENFQDVVAEGVLVRRFEKP